MQSMHCALSLVEQASQRCFTSMDRRVADMGDRLERFEKQCANHDEQVSALKHGVATAMVAQPQDAQVFDEKFDAARGESAHQARSLRNEPLPGRLHQDGARSTGSDDGQRWTKQEVRVFFCGELELTDALSLMDCDARRLSFAAKYCGCDDWLFAVCKGTKQRCLKM